MKKILLALAAVAVVFSGCNKGFDERLTNLENRVSELEAYVANLNAEVQGIQTIVSNLQKNVYVTGVETIKNDSGAEIGYRLTFNQGNPIEVKHGNTGAIGLTGESGKTPTIDIAEDGNWYWKYLGGDWITDSNNKKIPVYKSLEFEVANGHLFVKVDGSTAIDLGPVQGEKGETGATGPQGPAGESAQSWYENVSVDEVAGTVTIDVVGTNHDLVLPFNAAAADEFALNLNLPASTEVLLGGTINISYTLVGCAAADAAVFVQAPEDWTVALDEAAQKITLTVGEKAGRVVVYAINNVTGEVRAKFVNYDPSNMLVLGVESNKYYFDPTGGQLTIPVSTGIAYKIQASGWLTATKADATKAVQHTVVTLKADANTGSASREGELTFWDNANNLLFSLNVEQKNYLPALIKDEEDNSVNWEETFTLKIGTNETAKKNAITIELSDDFTKGTYKIKNMFVSDLWYNNSLMMTNVGADYYADVEDGVMTVYKASKSYYFNEDIKLAVDLDAMTITSLANIACTAPSNNKSAELLNYTITLPKASEGGEESPYAYLFGEFKESFNDASYYGYPAKGTLIIAASDDPAHHLKMTFFGGKSVAVTTYADVSADGSKITTVQTSSSMGKFYSSTLDVYAAGGTVAIWGTLKFDYPTISDYSASR